MSLEDAAISSRDANAVGAPRRGHAGAWTGGGLLLGVLCGLMFGEYCGALQVLGRAYVGLLQMTVLPYLVLSLISKMGRLDMWQARNMGKLAILVLLLLWLIGILLIVFVSAILPPVSGASFFDPKYEHQGQKDPDFLANFVPTNVFRSLSDGMVPAVVVFCLLFGIALIQVPGKGHLLDFFDLCTAAIGRINLFLVRLAPVGLFLLTAAAAGTLRFDELSRLQGYLIILSLACLMATLGILPLLISGTTGISCRDVLWAAQEPLLMVVATGKLFVALPQVVHKCEQLLKRNGHVDPEAETSTASVLVPLSYAFPHLGKLLMFVFISFAAWYTGRELSLGQTASMAASGVFSSFASPLVSMPFFLDRYQLSQDLLALFILPGFITTRLGDAVGVLHLMALTLIVSQALRGQVRLRWRRLLAGTLALLLCLGLLGTASRWYLATTSLKYNLGERLLALEIPSSYNNVVVYKSRADVPPRSKPAGSTLARVKSDQVLRVGYHPDHLPYSFFNRHQRLVGMDVELMHRLAERLQVRLEFVPYAYSTVVDQLESGEIDVAIGGLMMTPNRLLHVGFTHSYQTATVAVLLPDHRRGEFDTWDDPHMAANMRLAVVYEDLAAAARRQLPKAEIIVIGSLSEFFTNRDHGHDGLIISAEEGAAWCVLYPEHAVAVPKPVVQRPVGLGVRLSDADWLRFLDRWLEFEEMDGSLDRLRTYWIEGGGTKQTQPRWCILRDVLHWLP